MNKYNTQCPHCGAPPGYGCVAASGKPRQNPHAKRVDDSEDGWESAKVYYEYIAKTVGRLKPTRRTDRVHWSSGMARVSDFANRASLAAKGQPWLHAGRLNGSLESGRARRNAGSSISWPIEVSSHRVPEKYKGVIPVEVWNLVHEHKRSLGQAHEYGFDTFGDIYKGHAFNILNDLNARGWTLVQGKLQPLRIACSGCGYDAPGATVGDPYCINCGGEGH